MILVGKGDRSMVGIKAEEDCRLKASLKAGFGSAT